ncbi:MAG: ABC transporter permease [Anaerolineales bacterium]|nr:ABC transporter permease [Anaerolineales bacterium]
MQSSLPTLTGFSATWSAFWAMVKKELIVMARYPVQFVTSFVQIFIIIAVLSLAATMFSDGAEGGGANTSGVVAYGFILFIFLSDTLWTIGVNVRHEQVQGTLEQLYLAPASKFANLVSRVANLLIWTGAISIMSMFGMAAILGKLPFENPLLGLFILLMSLSGTFGIGFAFAALTLRIKETAQTVANLAQFAFMIFCACFFPFSALPGPVLFVSRLIPLSYGVDAFRSTLMGYPAGFPELAPINTELIIVTAFGLLMPILGYWLYCKAEDEARRSGSLAQF